MNDRIQVIGRIRPLNDIEISLGHEDVIVTSDNTISFDSDIIGANYKTYQLDSVIDTNDSQITIFSNVEPLLESVMDGYNCSLFTYGQTGTGKTYTMLGYDIWSHIDDNEEFFPSLFLLNNNESMGIIPRSMIWLFDRIKSLRSSSVNVTISYLEIYNEKIIDLLNINAIILDHDFSISSQKILNSQQLLEIRETKKGEIYIPGITQIQVKYIEEVIDILYTGAKNRNISATDMNEYSSRSHTIFQVILENHSSFHSSKDITKSKLNLIDLAGSEKWKTHELNKFSSDKIKEFTSINKSLSALGNCISALLKSNKTHSHIPYRDSKLTRLLQDSIGGNTKTLFIVTLSPSNKYIHETISTLQFADRAMKVRIQPTINNEYEKEKKLIDKYQDDITKLKDIIMILLSNISTNISYDEIVSMMGSNIDSPIKQLIDQTKKTNGSNSLSTKNIISNKTNSSTEKKVDKSIQYTNAMPINRSNRAQDIKMKCINSTSYTSNDKQPVKLVNKQSQDQRADRQSDNQTDRQVETYLDRQPDRQSENQVDRHIVSHVDKQLDRETDRYVNKQLNDSFGTNVSDDHSNTLIDDINSQIVELNRSMISLEQRIERLENFIIKNKEENETIHNDIIESNNKLQETLNKTQFDIANHMKQKQNQSRNIEDLYQRIQTLEDCIVTLSSGRHTNISLLDRQVDKHKELIVDSKMNKSNNPSNVSTTYDVRIDSNSNEIEDLFESFDPLVEYKQLTDPIDSNNQQTSISNNRIISSFSKIIEAKISSKPFTIKRDNKIIRTSDNSNRSPISSMITRYNPQTFISSNSHVDAILDDRLVDREKSAYGTNVPELVNTSKLQFDSKIKTNDRQLDSEMSTRDSNIPPLVNTSKPQFDSKRYTNDRQLDSDRTIVSSKIPLPAVTSKIPVENKVNGDDRQMDSAKITDSAKIPLPINTSRSPVDSKTISRDDTINTSESSNQATSKSNNPIRQKIDYMKNRNLNELGILHKHEDDLTAYPIVKDTKPTDNNIKLSDDTTAVKPKKSKDKPLWKSYLDNRTGHIYYHNRLTNETTWEKPMDKELKLLYNGTNVYDSDGNIITNYLSK